MDIRDMHFKLKSKLSKIDSEQYRNLKVPEIDIYLNEALNVYVNHIAYPYYHPIYGIERQQRTIDALRPLVESTDLFISANRGIMPKDYWHYISGTADVTLNNCNFKDITIYLRQHGFQVDDSKRSFYFKELPFYIRNQFILLYDSELILNGIKMIYLKKHPYMHAAGLFPTGSYQKLDGTSLVGYQNCFLPDDVCEDIVDIAALLITTGLKNTLDVNLKKLNLKLKDYE